MCTVEDFPNYNLLRFNGTGVDEAAHRNDEWSQYIIPLSTSSGFFTTYFWTILYAKYGVRVFRIPHVLKQKKSFHSPPSKPALIQSQYAVVEETKTELETLRGTFSNREALWRKLRPW